MLFRLLVLFLLGFLLGGVERVQAEKVPEYFFFQEPADIAPGGVLREPGERIPVFLIHGFMKDDLKHERRIHTVFSFLHNIWVKQVNRKKDPFEGVFPVHYRYRPDRSYKEIGEDFAHNVKETFGEVPCIILAHSAGAMVARYAGAAGLPIVAVVGLSPAHGGSPGASMMYANRKILEDGRVNADQFRVIQKTLREIGVPDICARDLAWDNVDGGFTKDEIARYGLVVSGPHPPFAYDRYDHYGFLDRYVAPFAGFDFLSNSKGKKKTDRELEWEMMGRFNKVWAHSDGVVIPYPKTKADGDHKVVVHLTKGIGHREMFIDREVLELAWSEVQSISRKLLGKEPEVTPPPSPTPAAEIKPAPASDPLPERTLVAKVEPGKGEAAPLSEGLPDEEELDLGEDLDLDEDLGEELDLDLDPNLGEEVDPKPPRPAPPPALLAGVDVERVLASGLLPGRRRTRPRSWLPGWKPPPQRR
jgi:hypothetical protein